MLDDNTGSHMFPILWQFNYVGIHTVYTNIADSVSGQSSQIAIKSG